VFNIVTLSEYISVTEWYDMNAVRKDGDPNNNPLFIIMLFLIGCYITNTIDRASCNKLIIKV
jgi:hypothetical protein